MRILYGVVGEGGGHARRSKVVVSHLTLRGHDLREAQSSVARNLLATPDILRDVEAYEEGIRDFRPQAVITDFDAFAYIYARKHGIPILSIDNQQIIARCKHGEAITRGAELDYQLTKAFVKSKLPSCDSYVVTTFFYPPIRRKVAHTTTLVPPILRREILEARPRAEAARSDQVLVYLSAASEPRLLHKLNKVAARFVVYGLGKSERHGNCTLKPFDEDGFVDDLAHARAVVCDGGLSILGEAIYLQKPVFSVPAPHEFEQLMNARYLAELGYGMNAETLEPDLLRGFLADTSSYAARLTRHVQDGNKLLYSAIDRWLRTL